MSCLTFLLCTAALSDAKTGPNEEIITLLPIDAHISLVCGVWEPSQVTTGGVGGKGVEGVDGSLSRAVISEEGLTKEELESRGVEKVEELVLFDRKSFSFKFLRFPIPADLGGGDDAGSERAPTASLEQCYSGHGSSLAGAIFSPDGRSVLTAGTSDRILLQWNIM